MLVSLHVKDFAIIDDAKITFSPGFTALTGETGAGKSLLLDALSQLLAKDTSSDLIRFGAEKAIIVGEFTYDELLKKYLDKFKIDYQGLKFLTIARELHLDGLSICKINNQAISLVQLKQIGSCLCDIHTQKETLGLINPDNFLSFLKIKSDEEDASCYKKLLKEYKKEKANFNKLKKDLATIKEKYDFLLYQAEELAKANLTVEDENNLKNELKILENTENLKSSINEFMQNMHNPDLLEQVYNSGCILNKLASYDQRYAELKKLTDDAYYNLLAVSEDKLLQCENIEFDEGRFQALNNRLGIYSDLKRKYKLTTKELGKYHAKIKEEISQIENSDDDIKEKELRIAGLYRKLKEKALQIRYNRIAAAKAIETRIKPHLQDLMLKDVRFEIEFNQINEESDLTFYNDGIDKVKFMVSFNEGEPLKPLEKVASGGELSRFMLALKTVLGRMLPYQIKVFDEIDSGVSGTVAFMMGEKLKSLSDASQVICVTHLPQVASIAENHYQIKKMKEEERTVMNITKLDKNSRVLEIAGMLSKGMPPSPASLNYAREILDKYN